MNPLRFLKRLGFAAIATTLALAAAAQSTAQRSASDQRQVLRPMTQITSSQNGQPWVEWEQRLNADQRLTAFGPDLLGDQIDPNTGSIVFEHTDVSLPGNSKLEVSLRRRLSQGYLYDEGVNAEFGNWEYLVPRIVAVTRAAGWTGSRCSNSFATSFPVIPQAGSYPVQYLSNSDYSNGVKVEVPGQPSQQLLEWPQGSHWPADRRYTTAENWYFTCITANDGGQGFLGHAPNGDKIRFDRHIHLPFRPLGVLLSSKSTGTPRSKSILAASEVTDVNGNWVRYVYDNVGRLTRIHANDGREIVLAYNGNSRLVSQVTANPTGDARTWTYTYRNTFGGKPFWEGGGRINIQSLGSVTQPDGRAWIFNLDDMFQEPTPGECDSYPSPLTITHPYGVKGTFQLAEARHRKGLHWVMQEILDCPGGEGQPPGAVNLPWTTAQVDTISVISKQLEGPGMPTATWNFQYELDRGPPGSSAADPTNTTTVSQPDGSIVQYRHRWQEGTFGGALMRKDILQSGSSVPLEITEYAYVAEAQPGYSFGEYTSPLTPTFAKRRPSQTIVRRGVDTYTTSYHYDANFSSATYSFGHPTLVQESSSTAPGLTRSTATLYLHDRALWIVGLPTSVSRNGKLFESYSYDELRRVQTYSQFGTLKATYSYHAAAGQQGMVQTYSDALGHTYWLSAWKRGKPQSVTRPDGTSFSRVVDNNGWVTRETDGRGFGTGFSYNSMGWLTQVVRPGGFNSSITNYIGLGNQLQAVSTQGTQRTVVTYDAMLRPVIVVRDATDGSVAPNYERSSFDALGRVTFKSWPSAASWPKEGINTTFDALGRVLTSTETVAPFAKTSTEYLAGGQTRVTGPTGAQTVSTHRAFGTPAKPEVMQVIDPLGTVTATSRDIFGNVTQLSQWGTQNGIAAGVTRLFWYDNSLRLCRHRAPEFGDELFMYDAMDRLRHSSRGEIAGTGCTMPSEAIRTSFEYDARGRLRVTDFPSTTPDIAVEYDANGNKISVSRGGVNWNYQYNALDQLNRETLSIDGRTYDFIHGYNANGQLVSRTRVGGIAASFAPNALGRPTGAWVNGAGYVHNVSYHANGMVAVGHFGNGHVFGQTLTPRLQPEAIWTGNGSGAVALSRSHSYNVRGQLVSIADYIDPVGSRTFDYDAKGRLSVANGPWGSGLMVYDALDNLRLHTQGGRTTTIAYDGTANRVEWAHDMGVYRSYRYDARGNATTVGGLTLAYDFANQPISVSGATSASYVYDGNLKRVRSISNGKTVYSVYSALGGSVMFRDEVTDGRATDYLAVGPMAVRLVNGGNPEYTHADHLGSPLAATNASGAVIWRENYSPFGEARLQPAGNANQPGYTGHMQDAPTGLTYMQARYYDPVIGRFLATDPIGYRDQLNLYAYVHNDPINATDPDGTCTRVERARSGCSSLVSASSEAIDSSITGGFGLRFSTSLSERRYGQAALHLAAGTAYGLANVVSLGQAGAVAAAAKGVVSAATKGIATPYGVATQSQKAAALAARTEVEGGATLYRIGTTGKSQAAEAQFWSLQHPLSLGYASRYGLPAENVLNANFIEAATLRPGTSFITRPAPGIGPNVGGGIEVVVPAGGVQMKWFTGMP